MVGGLLEGVGVAVLSRRFGCYYEIKDDVGEASFGGVCI